MDLRQLEVFINLAESLNYLRQLEVFINLAESLNYSKTAENLHLSQPAVCRIIQRIESEVGVTLFYRNHREVQLTKNGKLQQ